MKKIIIATALVLSACSQSVVTEIKGNNITVQSTFLTVDPISADEADRICAKRGGYAKHASTREIQTPSYALNKYQHLFRCVPGRRKATSNGYLNNSGTL